VHEQTYDPATRSTGTGTSSTASETAKQAAGSAKQAAQEVTGTVKEQGRQVAGEVGTQARSVVSDVRQSVTGQVRTGHDKLTDGLRRISDDLGSMAGGDAGSPANRVVQQLGDTGRRAADYLQDRGPEGLLDDVQDFARRKPGTFLLAAAAAGFVIGRLGRSTMKAARSDSPEPVTRASYQPVPSTTSPGLYSSGYETGTTYESSAALNDPYATPTYTGGDVPPVAADPGYDQSGYPVDPAVLPERGVSR
jgi:hypothetical protein